MDDSHENIITQKEISDEPQKNNKNDNNLLIANKINNINNENENENTEEDIIMITNSCLDEQSFFFSTK